jgi:Spy/CpxP family protein refolding chaperone
MKTIVRAFTAAALACLVAGTVTAQQPGRGGPRGGGFGMGGGNLLTNKSVQQELKLTDEQTKKITTVVDEVRKKHQDDFAALRDLDQAERREKGAALMQKVSEETKKGLSGILQPEQEKRFKQIELQVQGSRAFTESEVQKALKLTDDQQEKIKTINEDAAKEMREMFQGGGRGNFQEAQKKMAELRKETLNKIQEVLNSDQKTQWKEMTGTPFEIKFDRPPGAGGGGRRPPSR